jgi:hypothetical protein
MLRAEKNLWQGTATLEPWWYGRNDLIPTEKTTAKNDDRLLHENNRGERTAIELFGAGVQGWDARFRRFFPGKSDGGST